MRFSRLLFVVLIIHYCIASKAQDNDPDVYANLISERALMKHIDILCSDSLEGRQTGLLGQKKAARYIADYFEYLNLKPAYDSSYFQSFPLKKLTFEKILLSKKGEERKNLVDFIYYSYRPITKVKRVKIIYLPNADTFDISLIKNNLIVATENDWNSLYRVTSKINQYDPLGYLFVKSDQHEFEKLVDAYGSQFSGKKVKQNIDTSGFAVMITNPSIMEWIFECPKNEVDPFDTTTLDLIANISLESIHGENVIGYFPAAQDSQESIILTSHYDHLGIQNEQIYPGADDNGSGTSTLLEIAASFAQAYRDGWKPVQNVVFIAVSGEEMGLLGSDYYVNNPVFPLEQTGANLNLDMIGRRDKVHNDSIPYVYLIGSDRISLNLHKISEGINEQTMKLDLDYTYNALSDPNKFYYRSDHYNFAKNGVPSIFYFTGLHEDYHQTTDTPEKLDITNWIKVSRLIFYTAWELVSKKKESIRFEKE
jgi:hypothetical protein